MLINDYGNAHEARVIIVLFFFFFAPISFPFP